MEIESVSALVCQVTRGAVHLGAIERRVKASGIGNGEGVLREGAQDSSGVVEEFDGLTAGVDDGCGDPQVLQPVDIDVGGRGLDGQAGDGRDGRGSRDCDRRGDEGDEESTKGRGEHCGKGSEGDRGDGSNDTLVLCRRGWDSPGRLSVPESGRCGAQVTDILEGSDLEVWRRSSPVVNPS